MRTLKSRLSTANKGWLNGFFAAKGVNVLMGAMRKRLAHRPRSDFDDAVLIEACEAFKVSDDMEMCMIMGACGEIFTQCRPSNPSIIGCNEYC